MIENILNNNSILLIILAVLALLIIANFIGIIIAHKKRKKKNMLKTAKKNTPVNDETVIIKKEDMERLLKAEDVSSRKPSVKQGGEKRAAADNSAIKDSALKGAAGAKSGASSLAAKPLKASKPLQSQAASKEKTALKELVKSLDTGAVKLGFAPDVRADIPETAPGSYFDEAAQSGILYKDISGTSGSGIENSDDTALETPVIKVDHVTMEFKREKDESSSIKELAIKTVTGKRQIERFKALDDVSFTVYKGEVVGIIGTNGSGKSTILKIISGVLDPTKGHVETDKKKIQLLTLGTGFDHELTGRENVYLNGAIIGYTKEFIDEKYDSIVKFAELEDFMEEKVKNYSSGMVSRLGFAIATAEETPEILILDEVLSVGDMFFRKKSMARIKEMIHGGSTVLIVSHSVGVIKENCTKAVWIEKGHLKMTGNPATVCAAYERMNR